MAEKFNQQSRPPAANRQSRVNDEESATLQSQELRRKKRIKLAIYVAAFLVFQVIVISVFGLVVMRVKSPKLRLNNIQLQTLTTGTSTSSAFFDMSFTTQVRAKNCNFGSYKYDNVTVVFTSGVTTVGEFVISKLESTVGLRSELNAGAIWLSSNAKMSGKVEEMMIMKVKKTAEMMCTIVVDVPAKAVRSLSCR